MLQSIRKIFGYTVAGRDGNVGTADDVLFDDRTWKSRYLVVDTGGWLAGERVLLEPRLLEHPLFEGKIVPASIRREAIEAARPLRADPPVSEQRRAEAFENVAIGPDGGVAWMPPFVNDPRESSDDPHLRSVEEVLGYEVRARDGVVGCVDDLVMEDDRWVIAYVVVALGDGGDRRVLLSPRTVLSVTWGTRSLRLDSSPSDLDRAPTYDPCAPVNCRVEERYYDFYGRPVLAREAASIH